MGSRIPYGTEENEPTLADLSQGKITITDAPASTVRLQQAGTSLEVTSTQVNMIATSCTLNGVSVLPKVVVMNGHFRDLFSQNGTSNPGQAYDFMEWITNTTPETSIPTLIFPFNCKLVRFSCRWCNPTTAVSIGAGEQWKIDIGTITAGSATAIANWSSLTSGAGIQTWNAADDGTFPGKLSEDVEVHITKGQHVAVLGIESGSMGPTTTSDATVCMEFELT